MGELLGRYVLLLAGRFLRQSMNIRVLAAQVTRNGGETAANLA